MNKLIEKLRQFFSGQQKPISFRELHQTAFKSIPKQKIRTGLKELLNEGSIIKLRSGKYQSNQKPAKTFDKEKKRKQSQGELLVGKVDRHPDGFGFFMFDDPAKDDLFIPRMKMNGAMHGDRVQVSLGKFKGKTEARVESIVERHMKTVVGRVMKSRNFAHVIALSKKVDIDIYLPKKDARRVDTDDVVLCEIIHYGSKDSNPEGQLIKNLGKMGDPTIDNKIVMAKYQLISDFPKSVQNELSFMDERYKTPGDRVDLSKLFTVTIDGESARDFDDAISIMENDTGYVLSVHIADVSHYVEKHTALDAEAYRRATSVYFPEFAIPMLPEKLSNDLCSLVPRVKRLTMTAQIEYDSDGKRIGMSYYNSIIRSNYRLTYNYVNDYYEKKEKINNGNLKKCLNDAKKLAHLIRQRRVINGTIDFELPETEFKFDEKGMISDILPLERGESHRLIEMFMIEANEAVSEYLEKNSDVSVYRVHGKPDARKLVEFIKLAHLFGVDIPTPEEVSSKNVQEMSQRLMDSDIQHILGPRLVRTMKKAIYAVENIGHFGLSSLSYTHFTSPIRRYPDLMVHRLLKQTLSNSDISDEKSYYVTATEHCSEMEQNSEEAEREIHLYKKLRYLDVHKDLEWNAHINRIAQDGFFIYIEKLLMTGFVPIYTLSKKESFYMDEARQSLTGMYSNTCYRIGNDVTVQLEWIDFDNLETAFHVCDSIDT